MFTALAIARDLQARSGTSLRKIINTLQPLRHVTITINGQPLQAEPALPEPAQQLLTALGH